MSTSGKEIKWFEPIPEEKEEQKKRKSGKVIKTSKGPKEKNQKTIHFQRFTEDLELWLNVIAEDMNVEDRPDIAYQALRGVLHAIRDRSIPTEVMDLSAQMPLVIRGIFLEGYTLRDKPDKYDADEFLKIIKKSFGGNISLKPKTALKAVLNVLYNRISEGEMEDIYGGMPKDIKKLWKETLTYKKL